MPFWAFFGVRKRRKSRSAIYSQVDLETSNDGDSELDFKIKSGQAEDFGELVTEEAEDPDVPVPDEQGFTDYHSIFWLTKEFDAFDSRETLQERIVVYTDRLYADYFWNLRSSSGGCFFVKIVFKNIARGYKLENELQTWLHVLEAGAFGLVLLAAELGQSAHLLEQLKCLILSLVQTECDGKCSGRCFRKCDTMLRYSKSVFRNEIVPQLRNRSLILVPERKKSLSPALVQD